MIWHQRRFCCGFGMAIVLISAPAIGGGTEDEMAFVKANELVMNRMMTAMAVPAAGNVDADFVNMMEPHHKGAIEMAELQIKFGRNEKLRRIAQEIIVSQQQEIVAMRLALGRPLSIPVALPSAGDRAGPEASRPQTSHHLFGRH
jgi:hypothetical protein